MASAEIRFSPMFFWPHNLETLVWSAWALYFLCTSQIAPIVSLSLAFHWCLSWHCCSVSMKIGLDRQGGRHSSYRPLLLAWRCILTHAWLSHINSGNAKLPGEPTPSKATKWGAEWKDPGCWSSSLASVKVTKTSRTVCEGSWIQCVYLCWTKKIRLKEYM